MGQALAEEVDIADDAHGALGPPVVDGGQHVGGRLDRGALHVVQDSADPAELLSATGPAGPNVEQHRERDIVTGGLGGVVAVEDQDAAVPRRHTHDYLALHRGVVGDQRGDETPLPSSSQRDGLLGGAVGDQGAGRAERLDVHAEAFIAALAKLRALPRFA